MNNPALKGEVSISKMLSKTNPRLRRVDVVSNSFGSCITNAPEELSRAPEMSFPKILLQPRMFPQQLEGAIAFEQLQSPTNTHSRRQLNKQVDVVEGNMQLVDFTSITPSSCVKNPLAINPHAKKLHRVHGIFTFPNKVESVLSERMFPGFQIHFFPPAKLTRNPAHANFTNLFAKGSTSEPFHINNFLELNFGDGNSSLWLKPEVSLPLM